MMEHKKCNLWLLLLLPPPQLSFERFIQFMAEACQLLFSKGSELKLEASIMKLHLRASLELSSWLKISTTNCRLSLYINP